MSAAADLDATEAKAPVGEASQPGSGMVKALYHNLAEHMKAYREQVKECKPFLLPEVYAHPQDTSNRAQPSSDARAEANR